MYMYINLAIDVIVRVIDFCLTHIIHTVHLRSRLHKPRTPEKCVLGWQVFTEGC